MRVDAELVSSLNWMLPLASSGRPLPSRSVHGARVRRGQRADRVHLVGERDRLARDVARPARLDRGAAVAEHVHREADARRDVLPVLHLAGAEVTGSTVPSGNRRTWRRAMAARQHRALARLADELVVAQAEVQRDAAERPAILDVDAEVAIDAVVAIRRQAQSRRQRRPAL